MKGMEEEAEFRRAQERLTMKHRNSSKWAKHALRRGAHLLDGSTKAAVNEQLRLGQELKQKVRTMRFGSTARVPAGRMLKYYRISWWCDLSGASMLRVRS